MERGYAFATDFETDNILLLYITCRFVFSSPSFAQLKQSLLTLITIRSKNTCSFSETIEYLSTLKARLLDKRPL